MTTEVKTTVPGNKWKVLVKVGDTVRVIRKAKDNEGDWQEGWGLNMDKSIGKSLTITCIIT